jgi:hypothetical protein
MTESSDQSGEPAAEEKPEASEEKSDLDKAKEDVMGAVEEGKEKLTDVAGKLKGRFGRKS